MRRSANLSPAAAELPPRAFVTGTGIKYPPLERVPAPLVRQVHQIMQAFLAEATQPEGLQQLDYAAMAYLDEEPGLDQRSLAARLTADATTTGQIVDRLEAMGLLDRRVDPQDRRARILKLTPKGERIRRRLRPRLLAAQDRLLACLASRERETFIDLLLRIVEHNKEHARPGSGRRRPRRNLAKAPS
jgi:MarR family transcriptional regulator, temperature-dependent positive regulator of motility